MYIKRLILEGFKSYKQKTDIEFDSGHNIIVGKNGSGKSNIFSAIQFVLSNKYNNLRSEDRYRLIYEDSERQALSASVEILFDNTDMRFPINSDEVSIKRMMGLKKDEYYLNGKHTTKDNIEDLLESAGFSRSNTYYLVQQGKVNSLIKMEDEKRLELLKEIAGTKVYEEKRSESIKLLNESEIKNKQISEIIRRIEKRTKELENEKSELSDYQEKDRHRRIIEISILELTSEDVEKTLKTTSTQEIKLNLKLEKNEENKKMIESCITENKAKIESLKKELEQSSIEKNKFFATKRKQLRTLEKYSGEKEQAQRIALKNQKLCTKLSNEIKKIDTSLVKTKTDCSKLAKEQEEVEKRIETLSFELDKDRSRLDLLQKKSGRKDVFKSAEERNEYLDKQIQNKNDLLLSYDQQMKMKKERLEQLIKNSASSEVDEQTKELSAILQSLKETDQEFLEKLNQRNLINIEKKKLWKEISTKKKELHKLCEEKREVENKFKNSMSREQYNSIWSIKEVVREKNISGYYGCLGELFTVKNFRFFKCVEKVVGGRLFFHVVEDDSVAAKILDTVKDRSIGRVTFMPLSQLSFQRKTKVDTKLKVLPMIDQLEFEDKFYKAIHQIFGKTYVAMSLPVASEFSNTHNLDAITLDGDRAFKRGSYSGGFTVHKFSRIESLKTIKKVISEIEFVQKEMSNLEIKAKEKEHQLSETIKECDSLECKKSALARQYQRTQNSLQFAKKENSACLEEMEKAKKTIKALTTLISQTKQSIAPLQAEKETEFVLRLTNQEMAEMKDLILKVADSNKQLEDLNSRLFEISLEKNKSESFQKINLEHQRQEYSDLFSKNETKLKSAEFVQKRITVELQEQKELLKETEEKLKGLASEMKQKRNSISKLRIDITSHETSLCEVEKEATDLRSELREVEYRKEVALERKNELDRKKKELGFGEQIVDLEAFKEKSKEEMEEELKKVNEELKEFSLNKKALDQYETLSKQRANLVLKKEEQDRGGMAIRELIKHLDLKKDEAISRTFRTIASHFSTVFRELVPNGKASLVISNDDASDLDSSRMSLTNGENEKKDQDLSRVETIPASRYKGIGIRVTFSNAQSKVQREDEQVSTEGGMNGTSEFERTPDLNSLSGGQQTIVALSLIFAIQRCDPAPFYFLDEIDANLDSEHRIGVTNLLRRLAETPTQIISTTFKPEALPFANRCFVVRFQDKVSVVAVATGEEASSVVLSRPSRKERIAEDQENRQKSVAAGRVGNEHQIERGLEELHLGAQD